MATALTLVLGTLGAATAASATSASQEPAEVDVALKYESSAAKEAVTQYLNVRESFQALQASRSRTIQTLEQEIAAAKVRLSQTSLDGNAIIDFADNYSGVPYVRGGTTPRGFDCSGYTSFVFAHFGLELPRTSQGQKAWADPVSFEDRQVGDLMFWQYGSLQHVAIYAGDGMMWDSPRTGRRVGKVAVWGNPTYGRVPAWAINGPAKREIEAKSAELKNLIENAPQLPIVIDERNLVHGVTPEVPASAVN
jgi:cell wall-associated NlpC family hydrolase